MNAVTSPLCRGRGSARASLRSEFGRASPVLDVFVYPSDVFGPCLGEDESDFGRLGMHWVVLDPLSQLCGCSKSLSTGGCESGRSASAAAAVQAVSTKHTCDPKVEYRWMQVGETDQRHQRDHHPSQRGSFADEIRRGKQPAHVGVSVSPQRTIDEKVSESPAKYSSIRTDTQQSTWHQLWGYFAAVVSTTAGHGKTQAWSRHGVGNTKNPSMTAAERLAIEMGVSAVSVGFARN